MAANVDSVPTLDSNKHLKTKHLDVPTAALVGTPASALATAVQTLIASAVSSILAGAPDQLNTLNELAAALGDDQNFATTVTNALASKLSDASLAAALQTGTGATAAQLSATYVMFKNSDGSPVTGKHVEITLTSDGTDIDNIRVVTP